MSSLYVFTAGNPEARAHLDVSIRRPVDDSLLREFASTSNRELVDRLREAAGPLYAWGAVPGPRNRPTWESMAVGDDVLTVYDSEYRFRSQVVGKAHDPSLAAAIWGRDEQGQTWEYMYFLTVPQPIEVPLADLDEFLHRRYQGFVRVSDERIDRIVAAYGSVPAFLEAAFPIRARPYSQAQLRIEIARAEKVLTAAGDFDAKNEEDSRIRTLQALVRRQGQPAFRQTLLAAYGGRCAITDCDVEQALEAAHIAPYRGAHTNHPQNGLLLRGDIHTLFDLRFISIQPDRMTVAVSPGLRASQYASLEGRALRLPSGSASRPNVDALRAHRKSCDW